MGAVEGKVALVTGGGNGIGRAVALALAAEGASVVVNDLGSDWHGEGRDEQPAALVVEEIEAAGGTAVADYGDVADSEAAAAMVKRALDRFGRLDVAVNTAGILRDRMLVSMTEEEWDAVVRVHLRGHFCVARAASMYWRGLAKETGRPTGGRIICFTSEAGLYGNVGQTNYAAAKGGIASFAITAAHELARYGVTCNTIAPRARTRMTVGTVGDALPQPEGYDVWDPANVAPMVIFLASDAGARYTGQVFVAGGGVVQVIDHYRTADELRIEGRPPMPDEIAAFVAEVRGEEAGPPTFPLLQEFLAAARD